MSAIMETRPVYDVYFQTAFSLDIYFMSEKYLFHFSFFCLLHSFQTAKHQMQSSGIQQTLSEWNVIRIICSNQNFQENRIESFEMKLHLGVFAL